MDIRRAIQSQYLSALAMLRQAVVKCPRNTWDDRHDKDKSWFKAYHALYFAHLYLQPTRNEFVRWRGHGKPTTSSPLSKEEVLDYLAFVEDEVGRRVPTTDLEAESGLHGIRVDKLELQLVNIRHVQQHTGELYERLGARRGIKLDWAERRHRSRMGAQGAAGQLTAPQRTRDRSPRGCS